MRIIKTKDLLVVETEKTQKLQREQALETVPLLEEENANLAFQLLEKDARIATLENEQANLTFALMEKGVL